MSAVVQYYVERSFFFRSLESITRYSTESPEDSQREMWDVRLRLAAEASARLWRTCSLLLLESHQTADERHDLKDKVSIISEIPKGGRKFETHQTRPNVDDVLGHQEDECVHLSCNGNGELS